MWEKGKNNNEGDWRFINLLISPSHLPLALLFLAYVPMWFPTIHHYLSYLILLYNGHEKMRLFMLFSEKLLKIGIVLNKKFKIIIMNRLKP